MAGVNSKVVQTGDDNFETFSILWLDTELHITKDNRQTQQKLRKIINHLKTFDNEDQCQQYILSLSPQDRLVLIVSGRCGRQLVPQIHQLRQLSSVYVYCMDKARNEQWAKNFTKVKVIVKLNDLVNQIKTDQKSLVKIEEPISINIFKSKDNPDKSTTGLNGHFVHSLLLIDTLIRLKYIESDKQQVIALCKNAYKNNDDELALIHECENEYSADKALWWYTRDAFLYKMLNKALRIQNIYLLFLFRFVIADIYQQLKQNQYLSSVCVYRGQLMSDDELSSLQRSTGELISINSFFSTSIKRHKALEFLNSCSIPKGLHRVLFVIDADPDVVTTKPFADITSFSEFSKESEVLFMIGCIFRLIDVSKENNERIWVIRMKLCGDDEHGLKKLCDHLKNEYGGGDNEVNLRFFGNVLREMGKYDLAEKMYRRMLNELPPNDNSLCNLYHSLGIVTFNQGEYNSSLQWFNKSLEIEMKSDSPDYVKMGNVYNLIGNIYGDKDNQAKALEYYYKAIEFFKRGKTDNGLSISYSYNNIAISFKQQKKYSEALEFYKKSLMINERLLPPDHPDIAASYNNIGNVYSIIGRYDLAMQHHDRSLKMRLKSLPPEHPDIAMSYKCIGLVYERKCELEQALAYCQKAVTIYRRSLRSKHPDMIQAEKDIQRISLKLEEC